MEQKVLRSILLILVLLLTSCAPAAPTPIVIPTVTQVPPPPTSVPSTATVIPTVIPTPPREWWQEAVFYEVFVRSFSDGNGDGIGDFKGLTEKLDYLNDGAPNTNQDLGVTALWLMPIHPSPSYHGYDVLDYYGINPDYGTLDDFKQFLQAAHQRGIRVIMDLVVNHSSSQHPWFKAAQDPKSAYRNWYIFSDTDPGYAGPWGEQVWFPAAKGGFYYATFNGDMPDLNLANPETKAEIDKVAAFWLKDLGVDGFRMDAVRYFVEEGKKQSHTSSTHAWLKEFHKTYKSLSPEAMAVGEVWDSSFSAIPYASEEKELEMVFNFELAERLIQAVYGEAGQGASSGLAYSHKEFMAKEAHYGIFLSNHDQNRVMARFSLDKNKAKLAAFIYLTAPGTPFIYYGEEIGMDGAKPDEKIRTPMQWSNGPQGGFTSGKPWEALNSNYIDFNVADQSKQSDSILSTYRQLVQLRLKHGALRSDEYTALETNQSALYAALRTTTEETLLLAANFGKEDLKDVQFKFGDGLKPGVYQVEKIMGTGDFAPLKIDMKEGASLALMPVIPAYSMWVLQIKPK